MLFHSFPVRLFAALAFVALMWGADATLRPPKAAPALARIDTAQSGAAPVDLTSLRIKVRGEFDLPPGAKASHASSLVVMPADCPASLTVFWFSGDRESGPQVEIAAAQLDRKTGLWSAPRIVVNRLAAGAELGFGLRRLGNPVGWLDARGKLHLFVVATGGGGWAASRVLHLSQSSAEQTLQALAFQPQRVMPLSWLWNTSFLVRNAPMPLTDGGMLLPVHFELGIKVPFAIRFDAEGRMTGVTRMSRNNYWLQPALLPLSSTHWMALMRDERDNGKIGAVQTVNGGQDWSDMPDLDQPNPDSALSTLAWASSQFLMAHNPVSSGRGELTVSHSHDGVHWLPLQTLEKGAPNAEFSYPAMAWVDGSLWVTYTIERERLAWQRLAPGALP